MNYARSIGIFLIIGVGAGFLALVRRSRRSAELKMLSDRPSLDLESIYQRYYAQSGLSKDALIELWCEIAEALELPPDKLCPEDRFGVDIGRSFITSENLDALYVSARLRAKPQGRDLDLSKISTVDEYVRQLTSRT